MMSGAHGQAAAVADDGADEAADGREQAQAVPAWFPAAGGVLGAPDAVLAAGATAVPQLEIGELPAPGAGGEAGVPVPVDVGDPQMRARVRAFPAGDDPHALRPGRQVQHPGQLRDLRARPPAGLGDEPIAISGHAHLHATQA